MFAHEVDRRRPGQAPPALVVIDSVTSMKPDPTYDNDRDNREEMYKELFILGRGALLSVQLGTPGP